MSPVEPQRPFVGPLETHSWPETLVAHVITPGPDPRVHGYSIEGDLAVKYAPHELTFLLLTGELPSEEIAAAFSIAMMFLTPISIANASVHATMLAKLCGASTSTTLGTAAIALGEQTRWMLDEHEGLLSWLDEAYGDFPARYRSENADDVLAVSNLRASLKPKSFEIPILSLQPTRDAALLSILHACGLSRREQLEAAIVHARLPAAMAEAFAQRVANFREYPINLPFFKYTDTK